MWLRRFRGHLLLGDIGSFGYAWLLAWLHCQGDPEGAPPLRQIPFLLRRQQRKMGIFATRGPRRVDPIGLSLIQLLEVTRPAVAFAGVDLLDGTPVIDLKTLPHTLRPAARRTAMRLPRFDPDHHH